MKIFLLVLALIATTLIGVVVSASFVLFQAWLMEAPERIQRWWLRMRMPRLARRLSLSAHALEADGTLHGTLGGCDVELAVRDAYLRADSGVLSTQYLLTVRASSAVTDMPRRWLALQSACPIDLGKEAPQRVHELLEPGHQKNAVDLPGLTTRHDGLSCWISPQDSRGRQVIKRMSANIGTMVEFINLLENDLFMPQLERGALSSKEAWMRRWALRTLLRLAPNAEASLGVLEKLARDPDPYVRLDALKALGEQGIEGLEAMATDMLESDDVRAEALRRWLSSSKQPGIGALIDLLATAGEEQTVVIAQNFGSSGAVETEPSLCALLHRDAAPVVIAAADALGRIGTTRGAQALAAALESSSIDASTRKCLSIALIQIRGRVAGQSVGMLSVSGAQLEEVGRLSEPTAVGALSETREH